MAEFHRKVELQTPEDLQYLVANARRAAKEYLDKDFPPDLRDEGDNTLHERIEKNVDEVGTPESSKCWH
jgi:kinetochor protein Mis14/NSL1